MNMIYVEHEFEALLSRFKDQTEQLYRMTLIDLRIFSGFITLQLAIGGWVAVNGKEFLEPIEKFGILVIDLGLAIVATALLFNNLKRRKEVAAIVENCNEALGYETKGVFLENKSLNVDTKLRPWAGWYYVGITFGYIGVAMVLLK